MYTKITDIAVAVVAVLGVVAAMPQDASAQIAARCEFVRDLDIGATGEDVRCLQRFLNSAGFTVSTSGVGSSGFETNQYQAKTKEAVMAWQTSKGLPSTGFFGPQSRLMYQTSFIAVPTQIVPPAPAITGESVQTPQTVFTSTEQRARKLIKEARDVIENAEDDIDDAEDDGEDVSESNILIDKAEDKLIDAVYAYIDEEYEDAIDYADRAIDYAEDATEDLTGDEDEAEEALEDAEDAIDEAWEEIRDAEDDDADVDDAEDLMDEAEEALEDAEDAFDDEDYDEAIELAEEAIELAEDAIDAIDY